MVPRAARLRDVTYDAIVLAGGGSTRLGVDKAALVVEGTTMLDRVLVATAGAVSTVVVGPERPTVRPVHWTLEDPPAGGPVAGIAAGLAFGSAPVVVVLSCDLPWLSAADVTALVDGLGDYDGFGLRDSAGHEQRLAAAYHRTALTAALDTLGDPHDRAVRDLVAGLTLAWTAPTRAGDDVDTWSDLA
jgi:molybdopterin-guanine dinucleotide biosynthesis protein A